MIDAMQLDCTSEYLLIVTETVVTNC